MSIVVHNLFGFDILGRKIKVGTFNEFVPPVSLEITGDWTNNQYAGLPIDYTGLTFIATDRDGTSATVTPTSLNPSVWGSSAGTQTVTFNYTEGDVTISASKSATVETITPVSLSVTGDWNNAQTEGSAPDTTGLIFTATYDNGMSFTVVPTVSPISWATDSGNQTATFSYTLNGTTVSTTKSANMTYTYNTVAGNHGSVIGSGTYVYDANNSQTRYINSIPSAGYELSSWNCSGGSNCSASDNTLIIGAGCYGNITATANFSATIYTITVLSEDINKGTVTGSTTYTISDSTQTKYIGYSENTGYQFDSWSYSGGSSSYVLGNTLTLNAGCYGNIVITANFSAIVYTITMATNNNTYGTTTSINTSTYIISDIDQSRIVTASVTDSNIYEFNSWTAGKGSISDNTLTIPAGTYGDFTVTGNFGLKVFTITVQSSDTSKGTVTGSTTYTYSSSSQSKNISYTPNEGCRFNSWSISGPTSGTASISENTLIISDGSYGNITVTGLFEEAIATSLTVTGNWANEQYHDEAPDTAGLIFTATYDDGTSGTVVPNISPSIWGESGIQTATFSYTRGNTVTATKDADVLLAVNLDKLVADETITSLSFIRQETQHSGHHSG